MNRDETLALYNQGAAAWNQWAQEMLSRSDKGTAGWTEEATADFRSHKFKYHANFSGFVFPGPVDFSLSVFGNLCTFSKAYFHGQAQFRGARFRGDARFECAEFSSGIYLAQSRFYGDTSFENAHIKGIFDLYKVIFRISATFSRAEIKFARFCKTRFCGPVLFIDSQFHKLAEFDDSRFRGEANFRRSQFLRSGLFKKTTFKGAADFTEADFDGATDFRGSMFLGEADFRAAKSGRSFDLAGASFHRVPNFIQASFSEAPCLDNVSIKSSSLASEAGELRKLNDEENLPARYRALKRLALQGHDHIREQEYFAEELKVSRFMKGKGALSCAVRLYQLLSDFGRSMTRPLWALALTIFLFWWLYLVVHLVNGPDSSFAHICSLVQALQEALKLSVHKALPFVGIGSFDELNQIYACLYGIQGGGTGELPERFTPIIPELVYWSGMLQTLLSILLIFLFVLALRNHFRIR